MSDTQIAYLPEFSASRALSLGAPVAIGLNATVFGGASATGTAKAVALSVNASTPDANAVLGGMPSAKQTHRDLAAAVKTIDARDWASRPRRSSLAR